MGGHLTLEPSTFLSEIVSNGVLGGWAYGVNGSYQPLAATSGVPAGTSLTSHGSFSITVAGTSITAFSVTGGIDIKAANVTVSSCLVTGAAASGSTTVDCRWSGCVNALVQDCELAPATPATSFNSAMGHDVTWQRCNMHRGTDGIRSGTNNLGGAGNQASGHANVFLLGNYIHGLAGWNNDPSQGGGASHNDPWQPEGGGNCTAIGNNFDGRIDGTIGLGTATAANWNGGNHTVAGSLATNSCIQFDNNTTATTTTGIVINNNWFDYGYIAINAALGSGNHFDSIQNNLFGHHTNSGVQINLVGTTVGTLAVNAFVDHVGTITTHA